MLIVNVKDKKLKNKVPYIERYVDELGKYLYEHGDTAKWAMYSYNYCNHCAIGLAYILGKKLKDYEFRAFESHFKLDNIDNLSNENKQKNIMATGRPDAYNHAYVIGRNLKTGKLVLIDMQREPIWNNMIVDISNFQYNTGDFIPDNKEIKRNEHNINEALNEKEFFTNIIGKKLFDDVAKRCSESI